MALDEVAQPLVDALFEGRRGNLLHAVVGGLAVVGGAGEVQVGVGVLVKQLQARVIAQGLDGLGAECGDFVGAFLVGDVAHVAVAKGLVALGHVMADIGQQAQVAQAIAENSLGPGVAGGAAKGIDAQVGFAGYVTGLRAARDNVDDSRHRLGAEQQALAAFEHFDAFHCIGRQGIQVQATVQAVVQAYAVEQDQGVVIAPAQQGIGAVVERAVFWRDVEAGDEHLHCPRDIGTGAGAFDLFAGDDLDFAAVLGHVGHGGGFHRRCGNGLRLELQGAVVSQ